jgi:hypothetical protein
MLSVVEGNANAETLYVRHGFRHTGAVKEMMPDGVRRVVVMARPAVGALLDAGR